MEYERIIAFTQRLQTEFSQAQILTKNAPPDPAIFTEPGQFIQISNVRPIQDQPLFKSSMVPVPEKISRFYHVNDVTRFQHDRPVYKGQVDKDNEFKSLWIERTIIDIEEPLPGILRWFEVINRSVQELTPVEFACETMENVQRELWELIVQYRTDPSRNINPFSMRLQGIIDANVMGGISKYQEAFFSEQFKLSPEGRGQQANVQHLKSLILEQIQILDTALELHGTLAPEGVQPLHNRLLERYSQLKQSTAGMEKFRRQFSESIVNTPLPPLPVEKRAMSLGGNTYHMNNGARNYSQGNYEQDEIYTRPTDGQHHRQCQSVSRMNNHPPSHSPNNTSIGDPVETADTAPPVPIRPKSAGFVGESPEVPPKLSIKDSRQTPGSKVVTAPPLPPRGCTPDKRASNPINFSNSYAEINLGDDNHSQQTPNIPKRAHPKMQVINISLEDQTEVDNHMGQSNVTFNGEPQPPIDFRDSGISTASNDLNNPSGYTEYSEDNNTNGDDNNDIEAIDTLDVTVPNECLNIQMLKAQMDAIDLENDNNPPPIPKKTNNHLERPSIATTIDNEQFQEQTLQTNVTPVPPDDLNENIEIDNASSDGYCVPKKLKKENAQ